MTPAERLAAEAAALRMRAAEREKAIAVDRALADLLDRLALAGSIDAPATPESPIHIFGDGGAARFLGETEDAVRSARRKGKLPAQRVGTPEGPKWAFALADLEARRLARARLKGALRLSAAAEAGRRRPLRAGLGRATNPKA